MKNDRNRTGEHEILNDNFDRMTYKIMTQNFIFCQGGKFLLICGLYLICYKLNTLLWMVYTSTCIKTW